MLAGMGIWEWILVGYSEGRDEVRGGGNWFCTLRIVICIAFSFLGRSGFF